LIENARDALLLEELHLKSQKLGVVLTSEQLLAIKLFCLEIIDYSKHTNLTGNADLAVLLGEHVLDAVALIPHFESDSPGRPAKLIDIGSGAGFPAIILGICLPHLKATLVESAKKKCRFIERVCQLLKMETRFSVIAQRAEELGHDLRHRGHYDWGTARAVGAFDLSAELVFPYLAIGGKFIAQKSLAQSEDELLRAQVCLPKLGGKIHASKSLDASILSKSRLLIIASKLEPTKPDYARTWTKIKSKPLGMV
jgi:16S rRNA (guanine527-N7)-methyltransferase